MPDRPSTVRVVANIFHTGAVLLMAARPSAGHGHPFSPLPAAILDNEVGVRRMVTRLGGQ
jgi:hypothetical protein